MKVGTALLRQLERCGMAAALAQEHRERGEDKHGMRDVRTEIARSYAVQDQPQLPEAEAAMRWLIGSGTVESVGETFDLTDEATGEVLASGCVGAVMTNRGEGGEAEIVTVVDWRHADEFDMPEPEDDLGLVALGLAAAKGRPFRVATVALRELESFPRRSNVIPPDQHPAILARVRKAVSQPRDVACPGEWCGACRQNVHCDAWRGRAVTALTVFEAEVPMTEDQIPQLDLTDDTCGKLIERIKYIKKAIKLAEDQAYAFVRRGGRCVVGGKQLCLGSRDGRETASASGLKEVIAQLESTEELCDRNALVAKLRGLLKTGEPFEMPTWRSLKAGRK